jgi:hypothetical protein
MCDRPAHSRTVVTATAITSGDTSSVASGLHVSLGSTDLTQRYTNIGEPTAAASEAPLILRKTIADATPINAGTTISTRSGVIALSRVGA